MKIEKVRELDVLLVIKGEMLETDPVMDISYAMRIAKELDKTLTIGILHTPEDSFSMHMDVAALFRTAMREKGKDVNHGVMGLEAGPEAYVLFGDDWSEILNEWGDDEHIDLVVLDWDGEKLLPNMKDLIADLLDGLPDSIKDLEKAMDENLRK